MGEALAKVLPFAVTHARRSDPQTSKDAAAKQTPEPSRKNRAGLLLDAFRYAMDEINAKEACWAAFRSDKGWQRVSDLKALGYIEAVGRKDGMETFVLTDDGYDKWKELFG